MMGALTSLLPNLGGPSTQARRLYLSVWESVVLYAAPAWARALDIESNRAVLRRAHRSSLGRATTAYRTVSYQALCVLAGRIPIHLKVRMGEKVFLAKMADKDNPEVAGNPALLSERVRSRKSAALKEAIDEWQAMWDSYGRTNWTRRIVPSVQTFLGVAGVEFQLDYWISQLLSSHGAFKAFKFKIKKARDAACDDCGGESVDDAEHVLTECPTYEVERQVLSRAIRAPVEATTIIGLAMSSPERWTALREFARATMGDRAKKGLATAALKRAARNAALRSEAAAKRLEALRRRGKRKAPAAPPTARRPAKRRRILIN